MATVLSFLSCGDKIKTTKVSVEKMTDSTFVSTIDGHRIDFNIQNTRYVTGAIMEGDSAVVRYVGDLSDGHVTAVIVQLITKKGHVVYAVYDPSKKLETAPMDESDQQRFDAGIENARKHRH